MQAAMHNMHCICQIGTIVLVISKHLKERLGAVCPLARKLACHHFLTILAHQGDIKKVNLSWARRAQRSIDRMPRRPQNLQIKLFNVSVY